MKRTQEQEEQLDEVVSAKNVAEGARELMQQDVDFLGSTRADRAVVETDAFGDELVDKNNSEKTPSLTHARTVFHTTICAHAATVIHSKAL